MSENLAITLHRLIAEQKARDKLALITDEPELLVHGLPPIFNGNLFAAARCLPSSHGFSHECDLPSIINTREWSPRPQHSTEVPPRLSRAFVSTLEYQVTRDRVIRASARLSALTAHDIFGCGGDMRVYIRPVWPKQVFVLLSKARRACQTLGYLRPFVKNLRFFVRATMRSEPINILTAYDLETLKPLNPDSPQRSHQPAAPQSASNVNPQAIPPLMPSQLSLPAHTHQHSQSPSTQSPSEPARNEQY